MKLIEVKRLDIPLPTIPEPEHATIIHFSGTKPFKPFIKGNGSDNYVCGYCGTILCENVIRGHALEFGNARLQSAGKEGIVLKCFFCNEYNVISQYEDAF